MSDEDGRQRLQILAAAGGLIASLALAAWLLGFFERSNELSSDPEVAELQQAVKERRERESDQPPSPTDRAVFRERIESLTPEQREEFFVGMMPMMTPIIERQLNEFFDQPEEDQLAQIDREIDVMQAIRKQMNGRNGPPAGRPPWAGDPQQMQSMMKRMTAHTTPEMRSMMDRRIRMMNARLEDRGLQPIEFAKSLSR